MRSTIVVVISKMAAWRASVTKAPSEITDEEDNFEENEGIGQSFSDK